MNLFRVIKWSKLWCATLAITATTLVCSQPAEPALTPETWQQLRQSLGSRSNTYRILVDKVLMASNNWVMTPKHIAEIKAAGFNVIVPRIGADDNARVKRLARIAAEQGMFYMPWIRGTCPEDGDLKLRITDADGRYGNLASPNSDKLWDYWQDRVLFYAKLSVDMPSLLGVFLDFENYDKIKVGGSMCYALSYDEPILRQFCDALALVLPTPLPNNRAEWIEQQGQTQAFHDFQVNSWKTRARALRQAIDMIAPHFQFFVYPASQSLFIKEAVWREWHTPHAPLVMAEVETYWRKEYKLGDAMHNMQQLVVRKRAVLDAVDPTIRYMAGLDPIVRGANPEFEGKSAVLGAELCHGYWVFYEGPKYDEDHPEFFTWFRRANDVIALQDYRLWRQPAETLNPLNIEIRKDALKFAGARVEPASKDKVVTKADLKRSFTHRRKANYQVFLRKDERLQGELRAIKHAHIINNSTAFIMTPSGKLLETVHARVGKAEIIDMIAPEDGVYGISIISGNGKGQLILSNHHVCIVGSKIHLVDDQVPAYIIPRVGSKTIELTVRTDAPGEYVQITWSDPDGNIVFTGNTRDKGVITLQGKTGGCNEAWKLELTKAIEDIYINLRESCEPRLATHPDRLLKAVQAP